MACFLTLAHCTYAYWHVKEILINKRYRVGRKIGKGGFGIVYSGIDLQSGEEVALKLTHADGETRALQDEQDTYKALSGGRGIPQVFWFGPECEYYVLVHELLGPSLEDLFNYCGRKFSLKTVLLIADQTISRIEFIHSKGFLHRDIKPDNFLMGVGTKGNIIYAIDFGLAKEYWLAEQHSRYEKHPFCGTSRYASINNHNGQEQSWRDDLESLGYVLIYFALGSLPWQGLEATTDKEEQEKELVKNKKMSLSAEELCKDLPDAFPKYINYMRSLRFEDKPDYTYVRRLFRQLFISRGYKHDNIFDWTERRFNEIHGLKQAEQT
ncbi:Casein kinase I isoform delta [Cytospora mali]|uniref:non-specific serine/threonine protein kinase n=1 Tax=Cytospora mali TaxID=578113 RepID=A0A194W9N1_CYTMA|nr:Casein kinase I isoform delta [Valsa mali]